MDKKKNPGIRIADINLLSCNIGNINEKNGENDKLSFNLALTGLQRKVIDEGKKLVAGLFFDLMKDIDDAPFVFNCAFGVVYKRDDDANMTWDEFQDAHILTHVFPYLREFVANMTTRMLVPTLSLPPINVFTLLQRFEAEKTLDNSQPDSNCDQTD